MTLGLSKRHQARNERALQELIRTVPGNDRCADCQARNPGWASWNLGVFLCMRCAALHRKLGTHISKVKSLSMDSWTSEQVDTMKSYGNTVVNKIYNPRNVKPPIPIDVDEADSAMERFIRQKYELRTLEDGRPKPPSRQDPSYTSKPRAESPPPLPPKTGKRFPFSLRSVSSFSSSDRSSPRDESFGASSGLPPTNKQSRVFGTSVGDEGGTLESKLEILRDMGFPDDKRNATVLKGLNGNLDRTIESLVRLGEGNKPMQSTPTPGPGPTLTSPPGLLNSPKAKAADSNNPFDKLDFAPPRVTAGISVITQPTQSTPSSSTGGNTTSSTPATSYNPFDTPTTQHPVAQPLSAAPLEQSFQQLQVSQPLFPNMTGGYPSQQGQFQYSRQQQSMTPPVTLSSQNGYVASPAPMNGNYNPFFQPPVSPQNATATSSPLLAQPQNFSPTNPFFGQASAQSTPGIPMQSSRQTFNAMDSTVPRMQPPQRYNTMPAFSTSTSPFGQPQQQQMRTQLQPQQPQMQNQPQTAYNPFAAAPGNTTMNPYHQQTPVQQQSPLAPQQTGRIDKNSILALYNFSQPPPTIPEQSQPQPQQPPSNLSAPQNPSSLSPASPSAGTNNPFATSSPNANNFAPNQTATSNSNPFPTSAPAPPTTQMKSNNPFPPRTHMSQQSVDIGGMQNGRHSPDVFASLSARYVQ